MSIGKAIRLLISAIALTVGLLPSLHAQAQGRLGDIYDFMVMDVCVKPGGATLASAIPGDRDCGQHRNTEPGEMPPYILGNFPSPGSDCRQGTIAKLNLPVTRLSTTRIVSSSLKGRSADCRGPDANASGGASIQWRDNGYGFIMGSYSPVALSVYESSNCLRHSDSSERFFRGWVIAPTPVPAVGTTGYGVFESALLTGAASSHMGACSPKYRRALTTWTVAPFAYKSGRDFVSIVSSHFAQVAGDEKSPGESRQMEQTYWTREFGLTRWEKWAREDWINPRSHQGALELAQALYARGRCSQPFDRNLNFNSEMQISSSATGAGKIYARTIRNPISGEQHVWVMTLCEDYTNVMPNSNTSPSPQNLPDLADEAYWR
ncbi:hypothetical protein [Rhizobium sp. BK376]|jgi:hypothetical protein|uniref:hypothetical protein n=1 Tax=Rhizobium sp. BK376 TaxID=2512149 RepID=UPI001052E02F|nr:hypothetical protein [Rhizobium sp. BK376]TCR92117.1 hypothetical protein EV561_102562 [Rhizobium sp. BK376]